MEERYENMNHLVTNMWFKQKVFLAMKLAVLNSQADNEIVKFKAWKSWCENSRNTKYFNKKELLVQKIEATRTKMLMKRCYDFIRFANINEKFERTRQELEDKIPVRQELERQKEDLLKMSNQKDRAQFFRFFIKKHQDMVYASLQRWRDAVRHKKHNMDRVKLRLINLHKQSLSKALFKWKEHSDKKHMVQLAVATEDLQNENQNLENTLSVQKKKKKAAAVRSGNRKDNKLKRVRNMVNRILIRARFKRWVANCQYHLSIDDGAAKAAKIVYKRRLRNNFQHFLKQVKAMNRNEHINKRLDWFSGTRSRASLNDVLQSWRLFVKRHKLAKKFLIRSAHSLDKQLMNEGFSVWK